ncbi:MAG: hypothetical protein ABI880_00115 [Acidobacteriota bacterium]
MHTLTRTALLTLCLAAVAAPRAQAPPVDGLVYLDANDNGQRDPGEVGVAGVAVSNQREVVVTGTGVVFMSVPDGERATRTFWAPAARGLTFGLARAPVSPAFTFLHGSDPHTSAESVARLRAVRALAETRKPDFVLMTGDLVKDAIRVGEAEASGYYARSTHHPARERLDHLPARRVESQPGGGCDRAASVAAGVERTHPSARVGAVRFTTDHEV